MNKRIKKLAEQAGFDWIAIDVDDAELEKFAEFIVRECMELGDKALQDGKWPGDVLKEHFGIEE